MATASLHSRLERLERSNGSGETMVFAFGAGKRTDLDRLFEAAPGLNRDAVSSVTWFPFGPEPLHIVWGPVGRVWGNERREWRG